ncbi:unnamed protein product [Trifolium pratense]|uniref:Uncharacterized protein n=1 Tax=Trifolium pratense TaxID=57577 RepID=A0ACB0JZ68_TRIPR|nr:unnamed protein product [Trifolium pratense]
MQIEKEKMAEILKIFYAMTAFLFLFIVVMKVSGDDDFIKCKDDADCPKFWFPVNIKCIDHECRYFGNLHDFDEYRT